MNGHDVLAIPMNPKRNDARAKSVREYLVALLRAVWRDGEGFSGKRPFGNSGWEHELYFALGEAKAIKATFDEDGFIEDCDDRKGSKLIELAIKALEEGDGRL